MKILITGATGSIGKELVKSLCVREHEVAILARNPDKVYSVFSKENIQGIKVIDSSNDRWPTEVAGFTPEVVVHLAALLTSKDDLNIIPVLIESNITFGTQLLQSLKNVGLKVFINTGTFAEYFYGDGQYSPSYLYSATKTAFHNIIKYYQQISGFKVINVIPYTVYGQVDSQPKIIDIIYNSFYKEFPSDMSGGEQFLDFIHIEDVVLFYCLLIDQAKLVENNWEDYHLGTGQGSTLKRIASILSEKLEMPENINWGAIPYRNRDTMHSVAPIAKLVKHFNWIPTITIDEGINKFISGKKPSSF
ncbi:NAD-dependent epimerase/dehydratase family protein [Hymenobacter profundi]|uniref:NAD(P)-dependent oxidoreductase n=1 Tax=Hymenobacter profundi TaxID=1982110 RepID=A0ABS6WVF6_9BACT|nr:NAD(P)-dependent oxidoreductase [Hymenobacter profundi]MBW3127595.1 NAD(P)-dependent oxidoreductase [Hymenobacter profundi]